MTSPILCLKLPNEIKEKTKQNFRLAKQLIFFSDILRFESELTFLKRFY